MLLPLSQWDSQIFSETCSDSNCTQFPLKTAIYSSRYLQSMKRHLQAAILKSYLGLRTRLKTSPLIFHLADLFLLLVSIIKQVLFFIFMSFMRFSSK